MCSSKSGYSARTWSCTTQAASKEADSPLENARYTAGVPSSAAAVNVSVSVCSVTWAVEGSAPLRMAP